MDINSEHKASCWMNVKEKLEKGEPVSLGEATAPIEEKGGADNE